VCVTTLDSWEERTTTTKSKEEKKNEKKKRKRKCSWDQRDNGGGENKPNRHYTHSSSCLDFVFYLNFWFSICKKKEQSTPQTTTKYTQNKK